MQPPLQLPHFSSIIPEEIEPALKRIINQNRAKLIELLKQPTFTWNNLVEPLEDLQDDLMKFWAPVSHIHAVMETDELRAAYNACLPIATEYHTEILQNEMLYKAIQSIADSEEYKKLNFAQRKAIDNDLRDFKLAGVSLPPAEKNEYAEYQKQLSKLSLAFSENILDSTDGWSLHVTDANALKGLPEQTIKMAEENARRQNKTGWALTLDFPCYSTVMKHLENRELRWLMYEAYVTRASDQGPNAGRWDNSKIMEDILKIRHDIAQLVGYKNHAEFSLVPKMANTTERVMTFLNDLVEKAKPSAEKDMQELREFAKKIDNIDNLEAWDLPFYSEKLRQAKYAFSHEELRSYFPVNKVLEGMFEVVKKLYGIKMVERLDVDTWHPHVQFFEVYDEKNNLRGGFYTDLYARPHKRDGAWMDEARVRRKFLDGNIQLPVAFLTCNFNRPLGNKPSLLTHEEVITVFHEFGHCLHHMLTQVDYASVSGINGVPWDAVEFPSQFLEHFCWDKETLSLISAHENTGEPLPDALYNKLTAAKNFQPGMHMLRQLEFAIFDFRIHLEYDPAKGARIQEVLDDVRKKVSVIHTSSFNRFQHSFSHIFAGGYSAGYYSYEWAEVLAADAFSLFEERGIFDAATGRSFLKNILESGGSRDPMELFIAFRGREPTIDALLRHRGLTIGENHGN
jgi:oligopeptidase A